MMPAQSNDDNHQSATLTIVRLSTAQTFSQEGTGQDRTGQICLGNNCILPGQAWVQDTEFLLLQMSAHSLALAPALRENRAFWFAWVPLWVCTYWAGWGWKRSR